MKLLWLAVLLAAASLTAQTDASLTEQESLQRAIGEAGNSSVELVRAVERHLKQFPNSPRRAELERALLKTAVELGDDPRIIRYGRSVLAREPDNIQFHETVSAALLRQGDASSAQQALDYAVHLEQLIQAAYKNDTFAPNGGKEVAKRKDDYDRGRARALILEARARGLLGQGDAACQLAASSYEIYPSVEGAREAARWLSAAGKDREAVVYLADAFTIAGLRSADPDGAKDRARMGELFQKMNGSQKGLGDLILEAYDDTSQRLAARRAEMRQYDPNNQLKDPIRFTITGLDGDRLALSSLLGKVVVLDFWATWCTPCRAQHGLYEQAKTRFQNNGDVVFLSIDTDEDHSLVKPFLESVNWAQKIYFEDGLSALLQVSSIPTTIIFGKKGDIVSRMVGYLPERFVDMLSDRINEALGLPVRPPLTGPLTQ
ncbi:MAG: thioredoxin domain-containing protein [Bryobacteraceae bacterium]|jgi:thiol-disulfide isomerase/thioredoxin